MENRLQNQIRGFVIEKHTCTYGELFCYQSRSSFNFKVQVEEVQLSTETHLFLLGVHGRTNYLANLKI